MKKRVNLKEKVYAEIKAKILNFELKPGQKIYENEIANSLGVSRTPIREALSTLLQEGFVKTSSIKGYFVSDVTAKEIEELYEIREVLEIFAIRSAMEKSTRKDWEDVERELKKVKPENSKDKPMIRFFEDSHRFHQAIARICDNETLLQLLNTIADKIARTHCINILFLDRAKNSHNEHLKIVQMLKKGKVEEAIKATKEHIRTSKENLLHLLETKKNLLYFD